MDDYCEEDRWAGIMAGAMSRFNMQGTGNGQNPQHDSNVSSRKNAHSNHRQNESSQQNPAQQQNGQQENPRNTSCNNDGRMQNSGNNAGQRQQGNTQNRQNTQQNYGNNSSQNNYAGQQGTSKRKLPPNWQSIKNPKQIASIVRTKTLSVKSEFDKSKCENFESPLEYHSGFSRLVFSIINDNKKVTFANVKSKDIPALLAKSDFIINKSFELELDKAINPKKKNTGSTGIDMDSPAFTLKISSGQLRGMTPVQAILDNPNENRQKLVSQCNWLNSQTNQAYQKSNAKQIEAIQQAIQLFDKGMLTSDMGGSAAKFEIYSAEMRPLVKRKKPNGNCLIYEIKIFWHIGDKYPVEVSVRNYYAPVTQDEKGLYNVQAAKAEDSITNTMNLTAEEWIYVADQIKVCKRTFEDENREALYEVSNIAEENLRKNLGCTQH